jgi:uroporphyrinogen decarboxylase
MERYRDYNDYADVVNWGVYEAPMSLSEGKKLFPNKCILGGLKNHGGVLQNGTKNEIETEVHGIINDFGRKGFILGADCTIPNDTDMERLKTAINAARA